MRGWFAGAVALGSLVGVLAAPAAVAAPAKTAQALPLSAASAGITSPTLHKWRSGGTVVIGVRENAAPMVYALDANEHFTGYHLELCNQVVRAIAPQARLKYMVLTAQNTMPLIDNGTADFNCASMTNTLRRQEQVAFGLTTYVSEVRMAVPADSPLTSFRQLAGKKVVATTGTTAVQILRKYADANDIQFDTRMGKDHFESMLQLESGRVDAFVLDDNLLAGVIASSKQPGAWKIVGEVIGAEPIAIQFTRRDPEVKKAVDATLRQMMARGDIHRLYAQWFTQPIPPKGVNLNLPMGATLKRMLAEPNDMPLEQLQP